MPTLNMKETNAFREVIYFPNSLNPVFLTSKLKIQIEFHSHRKEMQKSKRLSGEALQIAVKRKAKSKGEKERYKHLNTEFQRIARRDKKASSVINAKK